MTKSITRRTAIVGSAAAAGALLTAGSNAQETVGLRRSVWAMTAQHPIMQGYATAVAAMRRLDQSNPSHPHAWTKLASIHQDCCPHGNWFFLPWHRMYLYYFERILRKASGSPALMLPYWDWTTNRAMPAPFTDSTPGNPLYTTHRGAGINGGALLPTSAVNYSPRERVRCRCSGRRWLRRRPDRRGSAATRQGAVAAGRRG